MKSFLRSLFIIFAIFGVLPAQAQLRSNVLDTRNKLEVEIQKNLSDLISTRLEKTTFNVAVRVQVKEAPSGKKKPETPQEKESLPAGLGVGLIDVRELVESYEKQIEEMKLLKESLQEREDPKFQATKIEVIVGLDESTYDEVYAAEFGKWLTQRVLTDFGNLGKSEVNRFKLKDKSIEKDLEKTAPTLDKNKDLSIRDIIYLVCAGLVVLGLIMLGSLVRSGLKENGTGKKDLVLEPKGEWALKNLDTVGDLSSLPEPAPILEPVQRLSARDLEHILGKIAFVCMELGLKVNELVRVWVDSGEQGYIKSALLIDSMMAAREKIMSTTGALPALRIPLDEDIASSQEENLAEAYRQVSQMSDFDRLAKLEEIYWDLISVKTLGLQSLRRPFDFLQSLNQESLKEVLETQKEESKALALMYLPGDSQREYFNSIENDEKEKVLKKMLTNNQISQKQIWDLDTSLKVSLINQSSQAEEKLVNLFPRTIEVLQTLDALSEIRMLRNIAPSLPEGGLVLKQQYTTLAFLPEWKPEYIRRLVASCTGQEIVRLMRTFELAQSTILEACTEKVRIIVGDDLRLKDSDDELAATKTLAAIKNKWLKIVANENIPMSKVIQIQKEGEAHAA